jgi:hypothetical protein
MKDLPDDAQTGDRFMNNVENVEKIEGTRASHKIDTRRTVYVLARIKQSNSEMDLLFATNHAATC